MRACSWKAHSLTRTRAHTPTLVCTASIECLPSLQAGGRQSACESWELCFVIFVTSETSETVNQGLYLSVTRYTFRKQNPRGAAALVHVTCGCCVYENICMEDVCLAHGRACVSSTHMHVQHTHMHVSMCGQPCSVHGVLGVIWMGL